MWIQQNWSEHLFITGPAMQVPILWQDINLLITCNLFLQANGQVGLKRINPPIEGY
jgi:hypothetical protein